MSRGWVVLLLLLGGAARADELADLRPLFTHRAAVRVAPPGGLVRIDLAPEVVAACRPDLADLRLFDGGGREVPYLVDTGDPPRTVHAVRRRAGAPLVDVRREETRPEHGPPRHRETYVIDAPAEAPEGDGWELVLTSGRSVFVRRIDVAILRADGTASPLVTNGSVFRLTNPAREQLRLPLPKATGDRLRVTLEGEDGFYLEPGFGFESKRTTPGRDQAVVPLVAISSVRTDGRTVIHLDRPRGIVPASLRVVTTTPTFHRGISVWDEGQGMPATALGSGTLVRLEGAAVEEPEIAVRPARGERLRVEIQDGDSPGLDKISFLAVVPQPALVASLAATAADAPAARLYFGSGRVRRPSYDLAAFAPLLSAFATGERAVAAERLRELAHAEVGAVEANPAFASTPAIPFSPRAGAEVDRRLYRYRRPVTVRPSPDGLTRLPLAPEDVANARADLSDVRIVDGDSGQLPYLLERDGVREWRTLGVERSQPELGLSRYRVALPVVPLRLGRVRVDPSAPFFDRPYRLVATSGDGTERVLTAGRLVRQAGEQGDLTLAFEPTAVRTLALEVVDGDDSALGMPAIWAELLLPELFFVAPPGQYDLLVGNPAATAPTYELARFRPVVLALRSAPPDIGEGAANPAYSVRARFTSKERTAAVVPQVLLWGALIVAVGVLTMITLRLVRQEPGGDGS